MIPRPVMIAGPFVVVLSRYIPEERRGLRFAALALGGLATAALVVTNHLERQRAR